ncbi:Hsp20/alpha crystallin family protein [Halorubellus sp. JP-L1]|uniref:Hsp20/alpha crystallin family protein n=1 Tax=Halorubellus sp. JP-L1 TaxID=2715753 RepID=UPI00140C1E07|nr:Hsp20/alpha crystallin family protein [Halorubellus sp. JP-L1]NHN43485.1 Hsp20/alpha crystallin family protein [Halorubellus sp. JP-L1]
MRRNPFDELEDMFDRMSRQLDTGDLPEFRSVPVDMQDHGDEYTVVADLPGFGVEDIDLTFADGDLRIDAAREESSEEADDEAGTYVHRERSESVSRTVRVPDPVVEDEITASYNNGTLTVTLPKQSESVEGHNIDIN